MHRHNLLVCLNSLVYRFFQRAHDSTSRVVPTAAVVAVSVPIGRTIAIVVTAAVVVVPTIATLIATLVAIATPITTFAHGEEVLEGAVDVRCKRL